MLAIDKRRKKIMQSLLLNGLFSNFGLLPMSWKNYTATQKE